jgi:hypothetical protein
VDAVDVNDEQYVVQVLSDWRHDPYDLASSNCEICVTVQRNAGFYSSHMLLPTLTTSMITICRYKAECPETIISEIAVPVLWIGRRERDFIVAPCISNTNGRERGSGYSH